MDSGGNTASRNDCRTLGTATGSVDSAGNPYYFPLSSSGSGLGRTVVDAVRSLANNTRYDVTARAVDNAATAIDERGFVDAIRAVSYPAGRCTGKTSTTFTDCMPGTNVNFSVSFRNDFVMPTMVAQVFNFSIQVLMDGTIQKTYPVRIVVPPNVPSYPETGTYGRTYNSTTTCGPRQRPDWGDMRYTTSTPGTTAVEFQLRTADSSVNLARAVPVSYRIPPKPDRGNFDLGAYLVANGQLNYLPYLKVTAVLRSSTDREETPVMTGFEVRFTCVDIE